jgi:hypothetical protein
LTGIDGWWDELVRDRAEAVLELVIGAIADDYESVKSILASINERDPALEPSKWEARKAVPVSRPEVISALKELIREGYAQAYALQESEPYSRPVKFREGDVDRLWFWVTSKGTQAVEKIFERISSNP